ncbi:hypothetical protein FACS1894167_15520 [Synergistales bacterium]|nr:hypothetical protein FACS1894167_15520 [Synergistales bacterium]GHV54826.1 hypothetical protein FACS1894216_15630 [Synergistales bacterium]
MKKEYLKPIVLTNLNGPLIVPLAALSAAQAFALGAAVLSAIGGGLTQAAANEKAAQAKGNIVGYPIRTLEPVY